MRRGKKKNKKQNWLVSVILLVVVILAGMGVCGEEEPEDQTAIEATADENASENTEVLDTENSNTENESDVPETEKLQDGMVESTEVDDIDSTAVVDGKMAVHFLDVGQGLAIFVQCDGMNLIYDGGDKSTSSEVVAYLKNMGVETIDYLISSHYDSDHVSGLIGCLNAFDVKNVIGSNYVHSSSLYTSFMDAVKEEGLKMQYPKVGTKYAFGDAVITILAPKEIGKDSNANSVAIKLSYGESDFIFTGDADYGSERQMVASGINLDCEVLSLAHHGSSTGNSSLFLEKTVPEWAVISCSKDNDYGHPHVEVVELLEAMEIDVFRSDVQGTVIATTDGKTITWSEAPCNDYSDGD